MDMTNESKGFSLNKFIYKENDLLYMMLRGEKRRILASGAILHPYFMLKGTEYIKKIPFDLSMRAKNELAKHGIISSIIERRILKGEALEYKRKYNIQLLKFR